MDPVPAFGPSSIPAEGPLHLSFCLRSRLPPLPLYPAMPRRIQGDYTYLFNEPIWLPLPYVAADLSRAAEIGS